ncbi:MAG: methyltransferase [Alphaproteobacteria bacterium]|nr:methyltransferase [Alphaproteobacteria bacterium]
MASYIPLQYYVQGFRTLEEYQKVQAYIDQIKGVRPHTVLAQNLMAMESCAGFRDDTRFASAFAMPDEPEGNKALVWKSHVLAWAAERALQLDGDFVECGVFRGFSALFICRYLDFARIDRRFYLYDSFAGLSPTHSDASERCRIEGSYERAAVEDGYDLATVSARFAAYPNVKIVPGFVPETFAQALPERVAYLHIDLNATAAEIAALEVLFPRLAPGGVVVLDDYAYSLYPDMAKAEAEFFARHGLPVLELPTGQGLVLKTAD